MARDDDDEDDGDDWRDRNIPDLSVLADRQRNLSRRVRKLERKAGEVDSLMKKGVGGATLLIGLGVFVGWLFAVGGNLIRFLKGGIG